MIRRYPGLLLLAASALLVAAEAAVSYGQVPEEKERGAYFEILAEKSRVAFDGDSTLHSFTGTTSAVTGWIDCRFTELSVHTSASVAIDARTLDTDNAKRDREMHKDVLETKRYPTITFTADKASQVKFYPSENRGEFLLHGVLDLHGKAKRIQFPVKAILEGETLTATGSVALPDITEYGIDPPSKGLGLIRVSKKVGIRFKVVAAKGVRPEPKKREDGDREPR